MLKPFHGKVEPICDKVIVSDMHFGEQKTASGLIIKDDNGTGRGIYPRWAKIHALGPDNNDGYQVGDWILVEHGRWSRNFAVDEGNSEIELRMVENKSILMWTDKKPEDVVIGNEYKDGESYTVDPSSFINA
jgi:co-chaperonin GroES (HSP10)|tara:strand:+ start:216 stop:611 length:396 start_codon:yes stop_codon:yes gene_type:complete